jgi:predicted 3-demethylubiquinone-9 3-methyltransferase (glyoxalase superfamily)
MTRKQRIIPCLWFNHEAEEAAAFYTSLFDGSATKGVSYYGEEGQEITGQQPGTVMTVDFTLGGYRMVALNGGPDFAFTPATSFYVLCETAAEVDRLWERLIEGGMAMMAAGPVRAELAAHRRRSRCTGTEDPAVAPVRRTTEWESRGGDAALHRDLPRFGARARGALRARGG